MLDNLSSIVIEFIKYRYINSDDLLLIMNNSDYFNYLNYTSILIDSSTLVIIIIIIYNWYKWCK